MYQTLMGKTRKIFFVCWIDFLSCYFLKIFPFLSRRDLTWLTIKLKYLCHQLKLLLLENCNFNRHEKQFPSSFLESDRNCNFFIKYYCEQRLTCRAFFQRRDCFAIKDLAGCAKNLWHVTHEAVVSVEAVVNVEVGFNVEAVADV